MESQDLASDIARLAALSVLALPVLHYYRQLRRHSASEARRYIAAIAGLAAWAVLGVVVGVSALPDEPPSKVQVALVVTALLAWLAIGLAGFLAVVPRQMAAGIKRHHLRNAAFLAGGIVAGAALLGFLV